MTDREHKGSCVQAGEEIDAAALTIIALTLTAGGRVVLDRSVLTNSQFATLHVECDEATNDIIFTVTRQKGLTPPRE